MNDLSQEKRMTLEEVLDAFIDQAPDASGDDLAAWVWNFPEFRDELIEFAAARAVMRALPDVAPTDDGAARRITRGMSVVRTILRDERTKQAAAEPPPASILSEGRHHGMNLQGLADHAGLSAALVRKLDRRLIIPSTIPRAVIDAIGQAIRRSAAAVELYLKQPPTMPVAAHYRASATPVLDDQEDFFDAVRNDAQLTREQRDVLLALGPNDETRDA